MRRLLRSSVPLAAICLASLSCDLLPTTAPATLELPRTPPAWEAAWGKAHFIVSWRSAAAHEVLGEPVEAGGVVAVRLPRTPPVVVRADPVWLGAPDATAAPAVTPVPGTLAWAGAVWPSALDESVLSPVRVRVPVSFEEGAAAAVIWRLLESRVDLRRFSVERLAAEIRERLPDDPWALDVGRVVAAIAERAMRVTYIRSPQLHPVALDVPEGVWHAWSPFVAPVGGGAAWPDLPVGVSVFHSSDGRRAILDVDEEGRAWMSTRE